MVDLASTPLFGLGLAEAIPDSTLARLADPDDADRDGISGRVGAAPGGSPARFEGTDPGADPEVGDEMLGLLVDYVRFLVPPARVDPTGAADSATVALGERLFGEIGCAACHVPVLVTGPAADPVFDRRPVAFYSDFLLHDLGPERTGVCEPGASPTEVRTARLAGVRLRPELLHDGRGASVERAIGAHGGEAAGSRSRFEALDFAERTALLRFLETL